MFRVVFGLILSSFFGLSVFIAFISAAEGSVDDSELGAALVGSFVFAGVPGWLLCYSGGQSLKRKRVIKASLDMLEDNNHIDIAKISSRVSRSKIKTIKDIEVGQRKGIIPKNAEIVRDNEVFESKEINKKDAEMSNTPLASASKAPNSQEVIISNFQEVIIEAIKLAIEIQKYAPKINTKNSDGMVSVYQDETYCFCIKKLYSQNASVESQVLITRNNSFINNGNLLKADIGNNFKTLRVQYDYIDEEEDIDNMQKLLKFYKNNNN